MEDALLAARLRPEMRNLAASLRLPARRGRAEAHLPLFYSMALGFCCGNHACNYLYENVLEHDSTRGARLVEC